MQKNGRYALSIPQDHWKYSTILPASMLNLRTGTTTPFRSSDGECTMRIVGVDQPREDQVYAVLYVEIAECPEISKVNILTMEYSSIFGAPVIL